MNKEILLIYKGGEAEIVEKKSRFISLINPINSEEEAIKYIEQIKKSNWNATHNCYAFVVGDKYELQRFSDDGEPSGTAGKPMLDILIRNNIHNALVVVTRYFGGTLLGTGGLVRAYQKSVDAGLCNCELISKVPGYLLTITADYHNIGKIQHIINTYQLNLMDIQYSDKVLLKVVIKDDEKDSVIQKITEGTNAKASIIVNGQVFFGLKDKKCIML